MSPIRCDDKPWLQARPSDFAALFATNRHEDMWPSGPGDLQRVRLTWVLAGVDGSEAVAAIDLTGQAC